MMSLIGTYAHSQSKEQKVYYVSSKGNDNGKGTISKPFKTIQRAADVMRAGDVCYIRQGVYREKIKPSNDGTSVSPINFYSYKNDTVVLTANKPIAKWEHFKGNIYKAYCKDSVIQLFCNHQEMPIASYPDYPNRLNAENWADAYADNSGDIKFKDGKQYPKDYWKGAYCRILAGKKWVAFIGRITSSSNDVVHCINRDEPFEKINAQVYLGDGKACIVGCMNALDNDNEWLWQNDTLYYCAPKSVSISRLQLEARTFTNAINASGRKNIVFSGLNLFAASVDLSNAEGCIFENGSVQYPTPFHWYGSGWGRQYSYKNDPHATDKWSGKGVYLSGANNIIQNTYVAHSWGDGVSLGGTNNTVKNCLIEDCDWSLTDCAAISATGYKLNITDNTCQKAGRSIIVHRFADKISIMRNHLYDAGLGTDDLGLTYAFHSNGDGAEIAYNWVHDNHAPHTNTGIYLDNQDTAFVVHHNVVWNCSYGIQTNKDAVNHEIYNNTVFNCKNPSWAWGPEGTSVIGQKVYNNLTEYPFVVGNDFKNNVVDTKESLQDADHYDFRPKKNSKAIDAGIVIKGIEEKYNGKAPDAGAYEYGDIAWKAGSNVVPVGDIFPKTKGSR
jgi:hypothetical protein